jgi:hypothetical protein
LTSRPATLESRDDTEGPLAPGHERFTPNPAPHGLRP